MKHVITSVYDESIHLRSTLQGLYDSDCVTTKTLRKGQCTWRLNFKNHMALSLPIKHLWAEQAHRNPPSWFWEWLTSWIDPPYLLFWVCNIVVVVLSQAFGSAKQTGENQLFARKSTAVLAHKCSYTAPWCCSISIYLPDSSSKTSLCGFLLCCLA